MNEFFDTHCHLNLEEFTRDLSEVIQRAQDRGVAGIIVPGIDIETSRKAIQIAERFPRVYAAVGVHPNCLQDWNQDNLITLAEIAKHPKVVAIGEIGLDYYRKKSRANEQMSAFQAQLDMAEELDMPVILHNRESSQDLLACLSRHFTAGKMVRGLFHAFAGNTTIGAFAMENSFLLGIGGAVTYNHDLRKWLEITRSLDHLTLETDSPFMTPAPLRGKRNEPANVQIVAESLSEIMGTEIEQIKERTSSHARQLFRLDGK